MTMQQLFDQFLKSFAGHIPELATLFAGLIGLVIRWVMQKVSIEKIVTDVEVKHLSRQALGAMKKPGEVKKLEALKAARALNPLVRPSPKRAAKLIQASLPKARTAAIARTSVPPASPHHPID